MLAYLYFTKLTLLILQTHFLMLQLNKWMNFKKIIGTVGDLQLEIKPRSLLFQAGRTKNFILYIEKGMQVIGSFKSDVKHNTKESHYLFSSYQPSLFRLTNLSNTQYSWSLYFVNVQDMVQTHMDTAVFDVKPLIVAYEKEILSSQKELMTFYKDYNSNPEAILDGWKKIKHQLISKTSRLTCVFQKEKIHLQFLLSIKNVLDLQLAKQEEEKIKRGSKQIQSKMFYSSPQLKINDSQASRSPVLLRDDSLQDQQTDSKKGLEQQNENDGVVSNLVDLKITQVLSQEQIANNSPKNFEIQNENDDYYNDYDDRYNGSIESSVEIGKSLSDIMERSYEGSSSYGQPYKRNNNLGFKLVSKMVNCEQQQRTKHNYESHRIKNSYRQNILIQEAAERDQSNSPFQSRCLPPQGSEFEQQKNFRSPSSSGYHKAKNGQLKWIICFILLVIFVIFAGEWIIGSQRRKSTKTKRKKVF